jgi:hypothetical protein
MPILATILYTIKGGGYSHTIIHKAMIKGRPTKHKRGLVPRMQHDGFASELDGKMEVTMWLWAPVFVGH